MVNVGVGQHDPVDRRRIDRQAVPVPLAEFFRALEEAAVHEQALAARFDQVFGSRNAARGSEKSNFRHRGGIVDEMGLPASAMYGQRVAGIRLTAGPCRHTLPSSLRRTTEE